MILTITLIHLLLIGTGFILILRANLRDHAAATQAAATAASAPLIAPTPAQALEAANKAALGAHVAPPAAAALAVASPAVEIELEAPIPDEGVVNEAHDPTLAPLTPEDEPVPPPCDDEKKVHDPTL